MGEAGVTGDQPLLLVLIGLPKLRHKLPCETKKLLVEALVFPHIYSCCTVWGGCTATQKHRIQKAINFATRVVTGLARQRHVTSALGALGGSVLRPCWRGGMWISYESWSRPTHRRLWPKLCGVALTCRREIPDAPADISLSYQK